MSVWGGNSLGGGVDCSGLVQQVLAHFGISVPRTTYDQINAGGRVNGLANAQPGDMVFFDPDGNGTPSHVGIYMGNGMVFSADHPGPGGEVGIHSIGDEGNIVGITRPVGVISSGAPPDYSALSALGLSSVFGSSGGAMLPAARPTFDWWSALGVGSPNTANAQENVGLISAFIGTDPDLSNLYSEAVAGNWSQDQFTAALQNTDWWKNNSDTVRQQLAMKGTDPSTWNKDIQDKSSEVQQMATTLGVHLSQNALTNIANTALIMNYNDQQIQGTLATYLKTSQEGWFGGYAGQVELGLKEYAADMGIPITQDYIDNSVKQIVAGNSTLNDNRAYIATQAALAFPAYADMINKGMTVGQIAAPYLNAMSTLWEQNPDSIDLMNPMLRKALQYNQVDPKTGKKTPAIRQLYDFQNDLRADPRWKTTNNAREGVMSAANSVLNNMGLTASSQDLGNAPQTSPMNPTQVSPSVAQSNTSLQGMTQFPTLEGREALSNPQGPLPTGAASLAPNSSGTTLGTPQQQSASSMV